MQEKKKIGYDASSYDFWMTKENIVRDAYKELIDLSVKAFGNDKLIADHSELVKSPFEYTLKIFWDNYCTNEPQHINKERVFESKTGLNTSQFNAAKGNFNRALNAMGQHYPTIDKNGFKSNLKKDAFNIYLNPAKEDEYTAVTKFLEAAKALKKYTGIGGLNVVRMHESILMGNVEPELNNSYFKL